MTPKPKTGKSRVKSTKAKTVRPVITKKKKRVLSGFLKGKYKQLVPGDIFNLEK